MISPNIERIEVPLGARMMAMHALVGDRVWLIDTGVANTPSEHLLPALRDAGITPADIAGAIITHCDSDHCGGNAQFRQHCPHATLIAHAADARLMQQPQHCVTERYAFPGYDDVLPHDVRERIVASLGEPCRVDLHLRNSGCDLDVRPGHAVRILHAPGHTAGQLVVHDYVHGTVVLTDAVLGTFIPDTEGRPLFAPTYRHLQPYLDTIAMIGSLQPTRLLPTHFPVIEGQIEVQRFLHESRDFAHHLTDRVRCLLPTTTNLAELAGRLASEIGGWVDPESSMTRYALCYPIAAAIEYLGKGRYPDHPERIA